jgi:hypothetical protein
VGVNVFGSDGFESDAAMRRAVNALFTNGVRHFRVVNVGAWADATLRAIHDAAGSFGVRDHVSVQVTSLFFDSPASCSTLPAWMDFSIAETAQKLGALTNIGRLLVQLDTCSICGSSSLSCINPTEQAFAQDAHSHSQSDRQKFRNFIMGGGASGYGPGHIMAAHNALPANVEFVIPYMNNVQSPHDMVNHLVEHYIAPLQAQGRRFHLEGTIYPFWTSREQAFAPFPTAQIAGFVEDAVQLGFDGFEVAETGWPQSCPKAAAGSTRPPSRSNMCAYLESVLTEAEGLARADGKLLTYLWKFGPQDDGSCGHQTFGLFEPDGSFVCSSALSGWQAS